MKTLIHFLTKGTIALLKRSAGKLTIPQVLAAILCAAFSVKAELIQHLDATVSSSVSGNPVTQWSDQSGKENHALKKTSDVYYPSASLSASGLPREKRLTRTNVAAKLGGKSMPSGLLGSCISRFLNPFPL